MSTSRARLRALCCAALVALSACSTGSDAVTTGQFEFVAPGGQTTIFYDPPEQRGRVAEMTGESLMEEGVELKLSRYEGKVVVLNVWGSWCGPCRAEADDLERVYEKTKESGVEFLGVNVRDERTAGQDFNRNFQVGYPSFFDPSGRVMLALQGFPRSVVPATIILDRKQRVAAVFLVALLDTDLLPVVERIAAEDPQAEVSSTASTP
ncbi:TlpA disulfide reductase family protein [Lentzea sp. CA-135723]|uniref:TlpA disulfide reductase family protein n=1 Tax=Lentzea sp. CA-135723 TaxID=3239950 RepID=UPI003D91E153